MIAEQLLALPAFIEYEGCTFTLELFKESDTELRLAYNLHHVSSESKHFHDWYQHLFWANPFTASNKGFLHLVEAISNDMDFVLAIKEIDGFLHEHKLANK